jgi:hypothetical protein
MENSPGLKTQFSKKLGWFSIGLCALCCTLPIIGTIAGIGSLAAVSFYLEKFAFLILAIAAVAFVYSFFRGKAFVCSCDENCDTNCTCKTSAESQNRPLL